MVEPSSGPSRLRRLAFDLLLGAFLLGLFLIVWLPPGEANAPAVGAPQNGGPGPMPGQGTGIVATINGAISPTDPTFTGQRHDGESAQQLSVLAEGPAGVTRLLPVEQVVRVRGFPSLTQITVRLTDDLAAGEFQLSLALRGTVSNKATLAISAF